MLDKVHNGFINRPHYIVLRIYTEWSYFLEDTM